MKCNDQYNKSDESESAALLSTDLIKELTGYRQKSKQRSQLAQMGIRFYVNRFGQPKVPRQSLVNVQLRQKASVTMPDIEALKELENG